MPQSSELQLPSFSSISIALSESAVLSPSKPSSLKCFLCFLFFLYILMFLMLALSRRAQSYLIYLHWLKPPTFLFPLSDLSSYRLSSSGRFIRQKNLCGWHLLPPGPPFVDGTDAQFDAFLSAPRQCVIIFFHGNSGTRACPPKRVDIIRLLGAHFQAHVVTFDYSGFADSSGTPSETQFYEDAKQMFAWVHDRVSHDSDVVLYAQSLGTFAAVDLAAHISDTTPSEHPYPIRAIVLDAPPASLIDAAMTHPATKLFRVLPCMRKFFAIVVKERLDSMEKVGRIKIPLLILHGKLDTMVDVTQGKQLYNCARDNGHPDVEFVGFEKCGHTNVNAAPEYLPILYRFLEKSLRVELRLRE